MNCNVDSSAAWGAVLSFYGVPRADLTMISCHIIVKIKETLIYKLDKYSNSPNVVIANIMAQ